VWILKRKLQKKDLRTSRKWTKDMDPEEQESRGGGGRGERRGGEEGRMSKRGRRMGDGQN